MHDIMDNTTIGAAFAAAASTYAGRPFIAVPAHPGRGYLPEGFEITFGAAPVTAPATASPPCWKTGPATSCTSWR